MRSSYKHTRIFRRKPSIPFAGIAKTILTFVAIAGLLGPGAAFSLESDEQRIAAVAPAPEEKAKPIEWRSTGIVHLELPLGFRARFDAIATRNLYHSEDLAEAFITGGPQLRYRRSLESRISVSRALAQNVEFEVAWGARSPIENVDLLNFERQTVGALIRIVH
ncbi:MAG: hypothetical protein AB8G23_21645 [Myxococcota bacterium]